MTPALRMAWLGLAITFSLGAAAGEQAPGTPSAPGISPPSAAPVLVSHVLPVYPQIAQSAGVEGLVELRVTIDTDGRVADVRVSRSQPLLDQAAIDAVRPWRFSPPSGTSAIILVAIRFSPNLPFRYPRPAAFSEPLPSWIPENFAFVYKYQCGRAAVEIDSIARSVTNTPGYSATARPYRFGFEGEQASEVFLTLVGAGFFDAAFESAHDSYAEGERSRWQEVAPVESGIRQAADRIVATVSAEASVSSVVNDRVVIVPATHRVIPGIAWRASFEVRVIPPPPPRQLHTLRVRRGDRWTETRWVEPVDARRSEHVKDLAVAGKRLRALVKNNLTDAAMRPSCL
jgi:TonB family protein